MTNNKSWLPLLVVAGSALLLLGYNREGFTGSCVKNPDAYLLDIEQMNGTDAVSYTHLTLPTICSV